MYSYCYPGIGVLFLTQMALTLPLRCAAAALRRPSVLFATPGCGCAVAIRHAGHRAAMPGAGHLRDKDIPYRTVSLVSEDGTLGPPTQLSQLLATIDPKAQFIELVGNNPAQPIVKIRGKKEHFQKQKEWNKRQKAVATSNVQKEIQMSWGVEVGDLMHKLNKVRKELEKGSKVELVFSPKQPQRPPTTAAMQARLQEASTKLAQFAKEWSPRKVEGAVAILYLKSLDEAQKPEKPSKAP